MAAHPAGSALHCGACNEKLLLAPDPGSAATHAGDPGAGVHRCPLCGFLNRADARVRLTQTALRFRRPAEVARTTARADTMPSRRRRETPAVLMPPPRRAAATGTTKAVAAA